ncbi:heme lyase CcmF/NrfE family subunit [Persicimonas caeni]|uniref:Heme lyase CcmF/NrfE family subunit n=1 Tax=Persicimonas caeni TaxID=2292766 RepID=A0A4Y6PYG3_PERCE|nr:heme lyase CcmF/NrfE family subunit [Persicimonas caeni]QDG53199.1 heme lyase CcmF/NrfE family subunit [Persicimonas caeni]QED34421.1 heme lyase CcmF/NrfE family subunit [Persicimonas caeni]
MSTIGNFAIYFALYVSVVGVALSFVAGRTGSNRFLHASRFAAFTSFGSIAVASSVLMHALITHDFSLEYVVGNTDQSMPLFYLIGAFWGGQAGSLLFWVSVVASFTALCLWVYRDSYREFMPWVTMVCLAVIAGLLSILAFGSSPFEVYDVVKDPATGQGLNPLLQTPKMVLHPPSLLTGLASMTVPFAFAIAALITGSSSSKWVEAARAWILVPWLFLSIGNILGGMWAYEELGWGGYWAWDPVENASFMPWLLATALIHSLMIQERRGMLKRWNVGLMIATFLLTIFGTYITRSGLIESVHTFAQSDIGDYFLAFLLTATVISVSLFAWRWKSLKSTQKLDSVASREASFMLNNWLFLAMTVVVFFGTLWPKIKEGLTGQEVSIGPLWFNKWMIPLGIIMLIMMGVGTVIAWRRATWKNFRRDFVGPLVATVIGTPALIFGYWYLRGQGLGVEPTGLEAFYAVTTVAGCIFVTATIVQDFYRGISARMRAHEESAIDALMKLFKKQRRRYGGYIVHLGVVFAFLAFAGNAMKIEKDVALQIGESVTIGDYEMTYRGLSEKNPPGKLLILANMDVTRNGEHAFEMHPGKAKFGDHEMMTSEIDIRSNPIEDFYVAFVSASQGGQSATFKVFVGPFTWWFWIACLVIMLGTFICLWPTRDAMRALGRNPMGFGRSVAAMSLIAVSCMPMVVWQIESDTDWGSALRWEKADLTQPQEAPPSAADFAVQVTEEPS